MEIILDSRFFFPQMKLMKMEFLSLVSCDPSESDESSDKLDQDDQNHQHVCSSFHWQYDQSFVEK